MGASKSTASLGAAAVFMWNCPSFRPLSTTTKRKLNMSTDGRDNEVPMPAEFRPYMEVELHAKVSGYVDQMYVDIGDRVKAGQLLATLEVPELRDEHARALAAEKRAVADYKDAHLVYQRLLAVEKDHPNLVAQQELDAAEAKDSTTEAAIAGAKAERQKDET